MTISFSADPLAVVLYGLLYYFSDVRMLSAYIPAVLIHEAGHLAAMFFLGLRVEEVRLELCGPCIRYQGSCSSLGHASAALAGPAAGALYSLLLSRLGELFYLTAGISLLLSLFNLLPVRPLDGGRIAEQLLPPRTALALAWVTVALLLAAGLWAAGSGRGAGLLLAGLTLAFGLV